MNRAIAISRIWHIKDELTRALGIEDERQKAFALKLVCKSMREFEASLSDNVKRVLEPDRWAMENQPSALAEYIEKNAK